MIKHEVETILYEFILQQFPAARSGGLQRTDSLLEHGIIDSLGILEIVTFIEDHYKISFSDDEMVADHFASIPALADLICSKLPAEESCSS